MPAYEKARTQCNLPLPLQIQSYENRLIISFCICLNLSELDHLLSVPGFLQELSRFFRQHILPTPRQQRSVESVFVALESLLPVIALLPVISRCPASVHLSVCLISEPRAIDQSCALAGVFALLDRGPKFSFVPFRFNTIPVSARISIDVSLTISFRISLFNSFHRCCDCLERAGDTG